jgi:transposase InsO family protein
MSKHRVVVLRIIAGECTVTAAAAEYGISRQYLHKLLARYREQGLEGLEPRSRAPRSSPQATTARVRDRIIVLRGALTAAGLDAGPVTIGWHLQQEGLHAPSVSTIRRILHQAGLITPEPRKRPRSSYIRFEAAQPNQTWQSDFTHWRLADGRDVEILNWLDDHSRYLLSCTVHQPVTGDDVVTTFLACVDDYGPPASTLTDNGRVYTARHGGGRNAFEYVLAALNITQKNGTPNHPQTQGKIERFHQTLKRWLSHRPDRSPSSSCKPSSTSSASTTTTTARTAPWTAAHPSSATPHPRKQPQPAPPTPPTTGSATTTSTPQGR